MPITGAKKTEYQRDYMAKRRAACRQIEIPKCKNRLRRNRAVKAGLAVWLRTYLPDSFPLPFSDDHLADLATLDRAIKRGGLFAQACPRGDGKTTRAEGSVLYAVLNGYRRFVVPIGADSAAANDLMESIKTELETNELLLADYPEVCYPIAELDGNPVRGRRQSDKKTGIKTGIEWKVDKLVLPTVKGSKASGAIICPRGITGRIRGLCQKMKDGTKLRPDFVLIDDPQTDESAYSETQCDTRERIIISTVLGLAGHKKQMAGVANVTIIKHGDLAHRLLDRKRHPEFQGVVRGMVKKWPDAQETLWKEYEQIRQDGLANGDDGAAATEFYRKNREGMDSGAVVAWEHQYNESELSALQHAENLLIDRGEGVFLAEYQNNPKVEKRQFYELTADYVASRTNGMRPWELPETATKVTCFIDVNLYGLHWALIGFNYTMAGHVVAYGKYPEGDAVVWDQESTNGKTKEQAIFVALQELVEKITAAPLNRGGEPARIDVIGVDCGYSMETVFAFARNFRKACILPSRGFGYKYYSPRGKGWKGTQCHITNWYGKGEVLAHNTDYWREQMQLAFRLPPGADGSISLYGEKTDHREIGMHVSAEPLLDKFERPDGWHWTWGVVPGGRKNDLGDCLTGARVLAHRQGCDVNRVDVPKIQKQTKRATYTEM